MVYMRIHISAVTTFLLGGGGGLYRSLYWIGIHSVKAHPHIYQLQQHTEPYICKCNKIQFVALTYVTA